MYLLLQVLCELELHKEGGQNTRVRARAVVRWINSLRQRSRHKELWIQSSAQQKISIKSHSSKECSGPEDKILATCLFLQKEDIQVYLLTDDNNLAKKAIANRVKKAGSSNIREVLTGQVEDTSELDTPSLTTDDAPGKDPEDLFSDTKSLLRDVLETVLVKELQDVYGKDLWRKIPSVNPSPSPPYWSLDSLFQLYCGRQDSGMFDIIFPEYGHNLKDSVEKLKKSVKDDCSHASGLRALLTHVRILVDIVHAKGGNDDVVDITSEKLANIQSEVDNLVTSKMLEIVSDVPQEDQEGVQELFQTVWEIIASFTQGFASVFSVHFDFPPTKREIRFESKEEAGVKLTGFYTSVSDLWEAMTDLLVKEEKSLGKETQLLSSQLRLLHSRLVSFHSNVLGMEEREWKNQDTRVNVRQLGLWVRNNNECLRGGLEQLNTMRDTLMSCIHRQEEEDDGM